MLIDALLHLVIKEEEFVKLSISSSPPLNLDNQSVVRPKSKFLWKSREKRNNAITKVTQLTIALFATDEIFTSEMEEPCYNDFAESFGAFFGLKIINPHNLKGQVLNRYKSSPVLEELVSVYVYEPRSNSKETE